MSLIGSEMMKTQLMTPPKNVSSGKPEVCRVCLGPGKLLCGGCRDWRGRYCSRECQVKDRPHHRALCKQLRNEYARQLENLRALVNGHPSEFDVPCDSEV